jgi:hypothetical protein
LVMPNVTWTTGSTHDRSVWHEAWRPSASSGMRSYHSWSCEHIEADEWMHAYLLNDGGSLGDDASSDFHWTDRSHIQGSSTLIV